MMTAGDGVVSRAIVFVMTRKALIRRPSPRIADGIVTHIERQPVDYDLARRQWDGYVRAMESAGWETIEVPGGEDFPDGAFIEDTMVVFRDVALIARPGADARLPEVPDAEKTVAALGYALRRVEPPGTLDGGDVLKVGDTIYVRSGGRTNGEGVHQLRRAFEPEGATVVTVPITKVLHLKSAVTALPDGTAIGYPPFVDDPTVFPRFLPVPEESGSHVVLLGDGRLLMAADCPRTVEQFTELGYRPLTVDIGEFQKLEGCVTCLSVRLRGKE
jgi:dimethylargininase